MLVGEMKETYKTIRNRDVLQRLESEVGLWDLLDDLSKVHRMLLQFGRATAYSTP